MYYLYNRIDGIFKVANRIAELVPSARIAVAHGRMHENEAGANYDGRVRRNY